VLPDILAREPHGFGATVRDGIVTLTGQVHTDREGRAVLEAVRHIQGVVSVRDRLGYPAGSP
jgi:osmotically-inducible protein OsmY